MGHKQSKLLFTPKGKSIVETLDKIGIETLHVSMLIR